jgi:hypothetical protein
MAATQIAEIATMRVKHGGAAAVRPIRERARRRYRAT